jgi:hypothetical protein
VELWQEKTEVLKTGCQSATWPITDSICIAMGLNVDLCEVSKCYIMKASEECESNTPFNIKTLENMTGESTSGNHWVVKLVCLKPFGCCTEAGDIQQSRATVSSEICEPYQ